MECVQVLGSGDVVGAKEVSPARALSCSLARARALWCLLSDGAGAEEISPSLSLLLARALSVFWWLRIFEMSNMISSGDNSRNSMMSSIFG